jgi:hypothetical protein
LASGDVAGGDAAGKGPPRHWQSHKVMDNAERLEKLDQLEREARELERKAEQFYQQIAQLQASEQTNSLEYRVAMIYAKATRQHLHAVRSEARRLRKLCCLTVREAQELKVPTFNHHFYHVAKRMLPEQQFQAIKSEADKAYREELDRRQLEP